MIVERGRLTYEKDGVNCVYEIDDSMCVSPQEAQKLIEEIQEELYPHLLAQHMREMEAKKTAVI